MLDGSKSSNTISKDSSVSEMVASESDIKSPSSPPLEAEIADPVFVAKMTILQELMEIWA